MAVTLSRDVRTGRSVWQGTPVRMAEALSEAGFDVLVLDRRGAVRGSTVASTALLQYDIDTPLILLARRLWRTDAVRVWRRSKLALDALRERTRHLWIETANRDALYLAGDVLSASASASGLRLEAAARRRAGLEVAYLGPRDVEQTCHRVHLGDRDAPTSAPVVARSRSAVGGVGPLPVSADHGRRAHHLRRCYAVLGFGGNGITFSALASQLIRTELLGSPDPDRDLFAF